jgi:hypothetical protein
MFREQPRLFCRINPLIGDSNIRGVPCAVHLIVRELPKGTNMVPCQLVRVGNWQGISAAFQSAKIFVEPSDFVADDAVPPKVLYAMREPVSGMDAETIEDGQAFQGFNFSRVARSRRRLDELGELPLKLVPQVADLLRRVLVCDI